MRRYKASNAAKLGILARIPEILHVMKNANASSAMIKVIMIADRINAKLNKMVARKHAILNINTGSIPN
ncbi:hypothetical protein BSPA111_31520 [Buttiauxella sp. A111]|nr:hypothetical protein BSPA111_31520 [Buttiauxella sp. A111]